MRILALDWGQVRVGAAISDEERKFAFPLETFMESRRAVEEIKKIIEEQKVEKILIGNPKSLSGAESISSLKVSEFVQELKKQITVPIELLDERFSSVAAGKMLSDQGMPEKKQREIKDNIAAQLMLQQYLDTKNN